MESELKTQTESEKRLEKIAKSRAHVIEATF